MTVRTYRFAVCLLSIMGLASYFVWFCWPMASGHAIFKHPDIYGYYFPAREWFTNQIALGHFPLWNDFWGFGRPSEVWFTVPMDLLTPLQILFGTNVPMLYTAQWLLVAILALTGCRYILGNLKAACWTTVALFTSAWTNYFLYYYVHAFWFGFHILGLAALIIYLESGRAKAWVGFTVCFAAGMLGAKLELSLIEAIFFAAFAFLSATILGTSKCDSLEQPRRRERSWKAHFTNPNLLRPAVAVGGVLLAILANAWQVEIVMSAIRASNRPAEMDLAGLADSLRALADSPEILLAALFVLVIRRRAMKDIVFWILAALISIAALAMPGARAILSHLPATVEGKGLALGCAAVGLSWILLRSKKIEFKIRLDAAVLTAALLAFYWGRLGRGDLGELEEFARQFRGVEFLVALLAVVGGSLGFRNRATHVALCSLIVVFFMRSIGNVFVSRFLGFIWLPTRDSYIAETAIVLLGVLGIERLVHLLCAAIPAIRSRDACTSALEALLALGLTLWPILASPGNPYYLNPAMTVVPQSDGDLDLYASQRLKSVQELNEMRLQVKGMARLLSFDGMGADTDLFGFGILAGVRQVREYQSTVNGSYAAWSIQQRLGIQRGMYGVQTGELTPQFRKYLPPALPPPEGLTPEQYYYNYNLNAVPPISCAILPLMGIQLVKIPSETISKRLYGSPTAIQGVRACPGSFVAPSLWRLDQVLPDAFALLDNDEPAQAAVTATTGELKGGQVTTEGRHAWRWQPAMTSRGSDQVRVQVSTQKSGQLVLTDTFDSRWLASIDGVPVTPVRAFSLFRAVGLAPGNHEVVFTYRRGPFYTAVALALTALLILTFACLYAVRGTDNRRSMLSMN